MLQGIKDMAKNIVILLALLVLVATIIFGIHYVGSQIDNQKKYTHPITRPGARW